MFSSWQQLQQSVDLPFDPYESLDVPRTAKIDEIRRSYKQKVLETHPDKLPPTASEEEKKLAQDLFHQISEAFRVLNDPALRKAYDVHRRPLPIQKPTRAESRASTLSKATSPPMPRPTASSTRAPDPPSTNKPIYSLTQRPHSGAVVVLEALDEAHERRRRERAEWASKSEERRLGKLKAFNTSEEIQSLGVKQAALVEKMIQDLFALTPEWEVRRMKARAYKASLASARAH